MRSDQDLVLDEAVYGHVWDGKDWWLSLSHFALDGCIYCGSTL